MEDQLQEVSRRVSTGARTWGLTCPSQRTLGQGDFGPQTHPSKQGCCQTSQERLVPGWCPSPACGQNWQAHSG